MNTNSSGASISAPVFVSAPRCTTGAGRQKVQRKKDAEWRLLSCYVRKTRGSNATELRPVTATIRKCGDACAMKKAEKKPEGREEAGGRRVSGRTEAGA